MRPYPERHFNNEVVRPLVNVGQLNYGIDGNLNKRYKEFRGLPTSVNFIKCLVAPKNATIPLKSITDRGVPGGIGLKEAPLAPAKIRKNRERKFKVTESTYN